MQQAPHPLVQVTINRRAQAVRNLEAAKTPEAKGYWTRFIAHCDRALKNVK